MAIKLQYPFQLSIKAFSVTLAVGRRQKWISTVSMQLVNWRQVEGKWQLFVKVVLSHRLKRRLQTLCSIKSLSVCPSGDATVIKQCAKNKGAGCKKDESSEDVVTLSTDKTYLQDLEKTGEASDFLLLSFSTKMISMAPKACSGDVRYYIYFREPFLRKSLILV